MGRGVVVRCKGQLRARVGDSPEGDWVWVVNSKKHLRLNLRSRVEAFKGSGAWDEVPITRKVPVSEAAILICDMWDLHWCAGAVERAGQIALRMAPVVKTASDNGVQIIHAPSDTMDFYAGTPQRRRIAGVPLVEPPEAVELPPEPDLPIDDSDGGCDTGETEPKRVWTRQNSAIGIEDDHVISDSGQEVLSFMRHSGLRTLIIMGIHTNMCVMNRTFSIKQMTRWGVPCVLVRDLTDAMYNPACSPHVSHDRGTELVIEHIERHWCPSVLSEDLLSVYSG